MSKIRNRSLGLAKKMIEELPELTLDQPPRNEFRVSSSPYCPILQTLRGADEASYTMDHYVETGTALHETYQRWLPRGSGGHLFWGDWKCTKCSKTHKACLQPDEGWCECGGEWLYEEVTIRFEINGVILTGHVDTILYDPKYKYYYVWDYKTCTPPEKSAFFFSNWLNRLPYKKNVAQIRSYCVLLRECFGIDVRAWTLIYMDRGKPVMNNASRLEYLVHGEEWTDSRNDKWKKYVEYAVEGRKAQEKFEDLLDKGKALTEKGLKLLVKDLFDKRPCKTERSWKNWMRLGFYPDEHQEGGECEFKKYCVGGNEKAFYKAYRKRLKKSSLFGLRIKKIAKR